MRVDTPPPVYEPIHETAVAIVIDNPKESYTNGDTIHGSLVFKVSEPIRPILRAKARLSCLETVAFEGPEKRTDVTHFSCEHNLLIEHDCSHDFGYGVHKFPFSFALDEKIAKCPPTISWYCLAEVGSGVHWTILGWIEESDATTENPPLRGSTEVHVYPFDRDAELALYENAVKLPLSSNLLEKKVFYFQNLKVEIIGLPRWIPRKPETFSLSLSIKPYEPVHLESVDVFLAFRVDLKSWHPNSNSEPTRVQHYAFQLLDSFAYGHRLDPAQPPISYRIGGCCLDRHFPTALELTTMTVKNFLIVVVDDTWDMTGIRLLDVACMSPSSLRDELEKEVVAARMQ